MHVIALVYSLAVLVWVIICLVSWNSQFGGTGSFAAYITCAGYLATYITFILDLVSRSAPWILYIISNVCLQMITALGEPAPPLVPWRKTQKLFIDCYKYRMLRLSL
jgi:hypothetical protein